MALPTKPFTFYFLPTNQFLNNTTLSSQLSLLNRVCLCASWEISDAFACGDKLEIGSLKSLKRQNRVWSGKGFWEARLERKTQQEPKSTTSSHNPAAEMLSGKNLWFFSKFRYALLFVSCLLAEKPQGNAGQKADKCTVLFNDLWTLSLQSS